MGSKRKELTADDLMRLQEGPRKRRREVEEDEEDEVGSGEESGEERDEEEEVEERDRSESGEGSGSESESGEGCEDEEEEEDLEDTRAPSTSKLPPPSFTQDHTPPSRMTIKPKAAPRAPSKPITQLTSFSALDISPPLINALSKMSIGAPTEIQAACIPPLLAGEFIFVDCIGNAKTGSGKTIAFALPILQKLSVDPYGIFALVLTPTRELAFQIADQFAVLGAPLNVRTAVIVGGMDMLAQAQELCNRPHVVVATPGRIVDHLRSSAYEWDLSRVKFLVLDEADRLLTPTFAPELGHLFQVLPKDRQTALFTATWTPAVDAVADAPPRAGKQPPFVHRITAATETVETLAQFYVLVPSHVREAYLYYLLCNPPESTLHLRRAAPAPSTSASKSKSTSKSKPKSKKAKPTPEDDEPPQPPPTMIFCARARTAAYVTHLLQELGIRSAALHARLAQRARLGALQLFRAGVVPVLVCTDVGARGLDVPDVALVVNWDLPGGAEEYTHRVGRTARAGRGGVAVSLVTERDEERVGRIEARIKTKLVEMELPEGKVLEKLNAVSTAKRVANMELHDSNFGERERIHQKKARRQRAAAAAATSAS